MSPTARTKLERFYDDETGLWFYFGYDREQPARLHVEVRGQNVETAVRTYKEAVLVVREEEFRRWASYTVTHGIYWNLYLERPGHVIIISCFAVQED